MADARKFILNSDYSTPAFVAKWEGSYTISANGYLDPSFNHNLPFTPLVVGQWSLNPNFQPAYDISTQNGWFVGVQFNQVAGSTSSKIVFKLTNDYGSSRTYYYRLFSFAPSDYDGDIPAIEDATNFRLNSDFNYPKLYAYGHSNLTTADFIVNHNLGYIPQARVWIYDSLNECLAPVVNVHYQDGSYTSGVIIDTSRLTYKGGQSGDQIYYHIYADEA